MTDTVRINYKTDVKRRRQMIAGMKQSGYTLSPKVTPYKVGRNKIILCLVFILLIAAGIYTLCR